MISLGAVNSQYDEAAESQRVCIEKSFRRWTGGSTALPSFVETQGLHVQIKSVAHVATSLPGQRAYAQPFLKITFQDHILNDSRMTHLIRPRCGKCHWLSRTVHRAQ